MNETVKRVGKQILKVLGQLAILMVLGFAIKIFMEGMWIFGLPASDKVQSVSISYPSVSEEVKEYSDEETIETTLNLTGYLKYSLFDSADTSEEPLVTITFYLADGTDCSISANETTVWWKDKAYAIKDEGMFVNLTNGCFFSEDEQTE